MNAEERRRLAVEVATELEIRGVPQGMFLVDIAQARQALQQADVLLRRLQEAITRSAGGPPEPPR